MSVPTNNETWVIERGDVIMRKEAQNGRESLGVWERLVYCLWVADYGMRNAGDLRAAWDVDANFQTEGRRIAGELSLPLAHRLFSLAPRDFEREYFGRFESTCTEIRNAEPGASPNGGPAEALGSSGTGAGPSPVS